MIIGREQLKQMYPELLDEQYQPAGIDLTLNSVSYLNHNDGIVYGLLKDAKVIPQHIELELKKIQVSGMLKNVYLLEPHKAYIAQTNEKIKIDEKSGQFYLPRSSLLRAGIDVRTAFGDPGFNGHLSFLLINHTDEIFVIEKGVRFAQLVNINTSDVDDGYDGDYNED